MKTPLAETIDQIVALPFPPPEPLTDAHALLTCLAAQVAENSNEPLPDPIAITAVQQKQAYLEGVKESQWAIDIAHSTHPKHALDSYPHRSSYADATHREIELLKKSALIPDDKSKILIIGSGPLPLTAYEYATQTGAQVDQLDISEDAVAYGTKLSAVLGLKTVYSHGDGATFQPEKVYDVVMIAALAGQTISQKQAIIDRVLGYLAPDGRILVRGARGLRTLFYLGIEEDSFSKVTQVAAYHPTNTTMNSSLVYKLAIQ